MEADDKYACTLMQSGWVQSFNERLVWQTFLLYSLPAVINNGFNPSWVLEGMTTNVLLFT